MISGSCFDLYLEGVICLQYADNIILFVEDNFEKASNLKHTLTCFENVSAMRINYAKKRGHTSRNEDSLGPSTEIFECVVASLPIKYLGIPLHYDKLRREDVQPLIDKTIKTIVGWR